MSNKVSVLVYSRRVGSPVRKAVLVYFAERASDNGEGVWASKSSIADAIECGRSTVIRTINDFVAEGILRQVGTRKHRNGETIEYAMDLTAIAALPSAKSDETSLVAGPVPERDQSQSGTEPVPLRDPYPSRSGTQTTIRTTIEPSEEPLVVPQPAARPSKRRRSTSLPPGWVPSNRNLSDAYAKNFTDQEIRHEADRFRDYHLARGTTFQDWDAGWRTWLGNARKFATGGQLARGSQHGGGKPVGGLVGAAMRSEAARGH